MLNCIIRLAPKRLTEAGREKSETKKKRRLCFVSAEKIAATKKKSKVSLKRTLNASAKKMNFITSENANNYRNRVKAGDLE